MEMEMLAQKASGDYWEVPPPSPENLCLGLCLAGGDLCMGLVQPSTPLSSRGGLLNSHPAQQAPVTLQPWLSEMRQSHRAI